MPSFHWFPFFPKDWLTDDRVMGMTMEERGFYIHLLAVSWLQDPPGSLPTSTITLARLMGEDPRKIRRIFSGSLGDLWTIYNGKYHNKKLRQIAERQSKTSKARSDAALHMHMQKGVQNPAITDPDPDPDPERSRSKALVQASKNGQPEPAQWPEDLLEIKSDLEALDVLEWFDDPKYWKRIDLEFEPIPNLAYLDELKSYVNWITTQPKSRQRRDHRRGFRNWLAKAKRMKENDAQRKAVRRTR